MWETQKTNIVKIDGSMFEESKQSPPRITSYQLELDDELLNDRQEAQEAEKAESCL